MSKIFAFLLVFLICFSTQAKPKHHKQKEIALPPQAYVIADENGNILKAYKEGSIRPIASISKLILAVLVSEQDQNENLKIPQERSVHSVIPENITELSRHSLLVLALVKSDNFAAQILCQNLENCVERMNSKAVEIGMEHTHYEEPTGLDAHNTSTADDLLKLLQYAYSIPLLSDISRMPDADIQIGEDTIHIKNTNPLTKSLNILLSKTGYTRKSGGCLVMVLDTEYGKRFFVMLGSKNVRTRIPDAQKLLKETEHE